VVPAINLKRRPAGLDKDAAVYVWGGIVTSGPFIVDLDNPYALTGYNARAMGLYRGLLRRLLSSPRCREIRCLSEACRQSLELLFGAAVAAKAAVHYPRVARAVEQLPAAGEGCRFLFIATQFEIKGGAALLRAFRRVRERAPTARLDVLTHLPRTHAELAENCPGLTIHAAEVARVEVAARFLMNADVLVHPTYVDSFGMVVLEALAHGLAVIATDVYALAEMVRDGVNGRLLTPPISLWDGVRPGPLFHRLHEAEDEITRLDTSDFEARLADAMTELATRPEHLRAAREASLALFDERFGSG
jgi:glycosyltransferase involved in cell wall biosynthesis